MKKLKLFLAACAAMVGLSANAQGWTGSEPAEGDFYLYNVGAGKFLNAGDRAANWGTNACLSANYGLDFTLEANGTDYNLNSKNSNGGASNYLATSLWTDGAATPWTFASVGDKVYNISNGGSYLAATSAGDDVELVNSGDGANAQWILVSRENVIAAMASATKDSPMNISFLLGAPDFNRNDTRAQNGKSWAWTNADGNVTVAGPNANRGTFGCEFWNNTFDINQTLTDMPNGTYEFKIAGYGTNGTTYIYGNTTEVVFANQTSAANFGTALDNIADGQFAGNTTGRFNLIGGTLKVGVKRATNKSADWAVFDNAELIYYGLDLSEFESALAAAVAAAEAVEGTVPTAAYNVLADVVAEQNKTYTSAADYTAATNAIVAATNTAKTLQANYARYQAVRTAVLAISNTISTTEADAQANEATTNEGIDTAVATVRQALAEYLPTVTLSAGQTIDLTAALIDNPAPGISGNTDYWTNSETPSLQYQLFEFYQKSGATTKQTILTTLPAGNYKLSAIAYTRDNMTATLNAGENTVNLVGCGSVNDRNGGNTWIAGGNGVNNLVFNLAEATANIEIGLTADNATGDHWMCWRSFSLVYGDVFEPYTLAEGKMNKDVAAAQAQADAAFKSTPSPTTYMAVINAIAAAEASIKAYAPMTAAIDKIDAALTAATSATASTDAYSAVKATYTEATIADADILTQVAAAYDAVIPVIKSQTAANADFTLAIQNQSFEYGDLTGWTVTPSSDTGARDASNPTYAATGSDGFYLFNTWWQGVPLTQALEGLPTGEYTLTASVSSDGATIYLLANGEHNDGIETYAETNVENSQFSKDTFQDATFTFLVKDGNLTIGVVGGAGGDAGVHKDYVEEGYWWYKADNFRLVKNRDLTPEEAAVVPADLAIDATSTIYKGKTTTLAATSTTEGASIDGYVNWTSDDTSVATVDANGVVTGVAYGTANITVTSTLNAEATATCAVTVTAPLITEAENLDFAEGPVHNGSIITTAADLSKPENAGAVARMQTVTGWTITENGDNRAAGVMQYNSDYGLGGVANKVPTEGPTGTNGYALAIEAVWSASAQYTQNVLLPAGAYKITMPIYNLIKDQNMSKNLIGFIADNGNEYLATATNYPANTWTTETVSFVLNEDTYGKLSLGFTSSGQGNVKAPHLFIDKMQVVFEPFATAEEIAALNTAIASAEEHTLGFDKDDYAPYKNVAALEKLAAAKALDTEKPIGQSQVTEATAALTSATWTANTEEVNAVYDGTFASAENNGAPAGWTMSNNTLGGDKHARAFNPDTRLSEFNSSNSALFIRFDGTNSDRGSLYYYGNTVGYTMPLKAGVTYYAKADIKGWGSTGKNQRMNVTGPDGFTAVGQTLILSDNADTDDATPQQFVIVFTATVDGDYVINFQTPGGDDQKHMAVISNVELKRVPEIVLDETVAWTPTASPSANVTLKRSFNSNWATFVVPFDIDNETLKAQFGEDVQVSTISADADNLNFSAMETPAITANEPVIMKVSNTAGTYTFNNVEIKAATPTLTPIEGVQVIGNYGGQITMPASDDAAKYYYIASNKLKYTTGTQTLKGFRAYFSVAADSPVKGFFENGYDFEGLPTAIDGLQVEGANATIYNLAGQRVNKVQKGIYIVNGKKVLVK